MPKKIIPIRIEVFDPKVLIDMGWSLERVDGNKYHSGGYQMVSPDGEFTIKHTVRIASGYRMQYDCTINNIPMWANAELSDQLRDFMLSLGQLEHSIRSDQFDKNRSDLLNKFTFKALED